MGHLNRAARTVAFARMTDLSSNADSGARKPERRRNPVLRELIDEMLVSIRVAANRELWTPAERTEYERELAEIMTRVRSEAVTRAG